MPRKNQNIWKVGYTGIIIIVILGLALYIQRINIADPLSISIEQEGEKTTGNFTVKGHSVLGFPIDIQPDTSGVKFNTDFGYFNKITIFRHHRDSINSPANIHVLNLKTGKSKTCILTSSASTIQLENIFQKSFLSKLKYALKINLDYIFLLLLATILVIIVLRFNHGYWFAISFFLIGIIWGYFWLFFASGYAYPNAEDLLVVSVAKDLGVFKTVLYSFLDGDARYTSNFFYGFNFLAAGGPDYNKYNAVISLILITVSVSFFIHQIIKTKFHVVYAIITGAFITILHFAMIPKIASELYWMGTCFVYLWAWILNFAWIGFAVLWFRSTSYKNKLLYAAFTLMSLVISFGTTEMNYITNASVLFVISYISLKNPQKHISELVSLWLIAISCFLLFIFTPSTFSETSRIESFKGLDHYIGVFSFTLKNTSQLLFTWTFKHITTPLVFIFSTLLFRLLKYKISLNLTKTELAAFSLLFLLVIYVNHFFYNAFAGYDLGYNYRAGNYSNWLYLVVAFVFLPMIVSRIKLKFKLQKIETIKKTAMPVLGLFIVFFIIRGSNNYTKIQEEHVSGTYKQYKKEREAQYSAIQKAKNKTGWKIAVVNVIETKPETVSKGPYMEKNQEAGKARDRRSAYEMFFDVHEVRLKSDSSSYTDKFMHYEK